MQSRKARGNHVVSVGWENCFNEAATMQSRKVCCWSQEWQGCCRASMRPRPCSRGKKKKSAKKSRAAKSFNEAATMQSRKVETFLFSCSGSDRFNEAATMQSRKDEDRCQ